MYTFIILLSTDDTHNFETFCECPFLEEHMGNLLLAF